MTYSSQDAIRGHLKMLTETIGSRPTGSAANRRAVDYVAQIMERAGLDVERQEFDCLDWQLESLELRLGNEALPAVANPFTPTCDVVAPAVYTSTIEELEPADLRGKIVVLRGELTAEPLFPKNFPFLTIEDQQRIIRALEEGGPAAIIAVSPKAADPPPIFEDGDLLIPSVTVAAPTGERLLAAPEKPVSLRIRSVRQAVKGANVIGRLAGKTRRKVILCAHLDTKPGTPGALDNAAGVATLLAVAEQTKHRRPAVNLEFVAFNGEDYYAGSGEVAYLNQCGQEFGRVALAINVDGVGLRQTGNTIALFACPDELVAQVKAVMAAYPRLRETEPWPQGDHTLFWPRGVPSVALTSADVHALLDSVIHTPRDTVELVDPDSIAGVVSFVGDLLESFDS